MNRYRWLLQRAMGSLGLPGWVGLALALACATLWFAQIAPLQREATRLAADIGRLEQRLAAQTVDPTADTTPQDQLDAFARRFAGEKGIAPALARLHAMARKRGVQIDQAEFKLASEANEPLARYTIVLPVKADYRSLRHFTRDALRELPGLALEEVNLRRGEAKSPLLESQLRFVLFLSKVG